MAAAVAAAFFVADQARSARYSGRAAPRAATISGSAFATASSTRSTCFPSFAAQATTSSAASPRLRAAASTTRARARAPGTRSILLRTTTWGCSRAWSSRNSSSSVRLTPWTASKTTTRKSASRAAANARSFSASPTAPTASAPGVSTTANRPVSPALARPRGAGDRPCLGPILGVANEQVVQGGLAHVGGAHDDHPSLVAGHQPRVGRRQAHELAPAAEIRRQLAQSGGERASCDVRHLVPGVAEALPHPRGELLE